MGDIDGNGEIDVTDVMRVNKHAQLRDVLEGYEFDCVNIEGDDMVDTYDVMMINLQAKEVAFLW